MRINIKVKPNSKKQHIEKISKGEYKICLTSPAKNNKANIELIKFLKKEGKKDIKIIKGKTSRRKIVEIN